MRLFSSSSRRRATPGRSVVAPVGVEELVQGLGAGVADHDHDIVSQHGGYHLVAALTATVATTCKSGLVVGERGQALTVEYQDGHRGVTDAADDEPRLVPLLQRPHAGPLDGEVHVRAGRAVDLERGVGLEVAVDV